MWTLPKKPTLRETLPEALEANGTTALARRLRRRPANDICAHAAYKGPTVDGFSCPSCGEFMVEMD